MKQKKPQGFEQAKKTAEEFAKDKKKTKYLIDEAVKKAGHHKKELEKVWDDLHGLIRLVSTWLKGTYKEVPWETIIFSIAAIIYFVNPFDVIADFIPFAGFVDDAGIILFVIGALREDIKRFKEWEKRNRETKRKKNRSREVKIQRSKEKC